MDELYEKAVAIWLVRKRFPRFDPDKMSEIRFGEAGGYYYSEYTQADDNASILFDYEEEYGHQGKTCKTPYDMDISYQEVGMFVSEVSEIIQELRALEVAG